MKNHRHDDSNLQPTSIWRQVRYGIAGTFAAQTMFSLCFWLVSFGPVLPQIVQWFVVQQAIFLALIG
ncbi:hypothetical protein V6O07_13220, partial [Arthrospira platensis SPKY2]